VSNDADGGLYEKVLAGLGKDAGLPELRPPRASASIVLWRQNADRGLEVFWIKRAETLAFMGGWYAFPGGGIARTDGAIAVEGRPQGVEGAAPDAALPEAVIQGVDELGPILAPGIVAGALRELFEETGLLVTAGLDGGEVTADTLATLARVQRALLEKATDFHSILAEHEWRLDASSLVYAGRWLTPPLGPLRFDNRFFLLEWPAERSQQPVVHPGEAELGEWVRPGDGLRRWQSGEIVTAPPILHILEVLGEEGVDKGLERLRQPEEINLGPFRRVEFRPGVVLFPLATPTLPPALFTNAYVVGSGEAVLIDPGSPFERDIDWLRRGLEALREQHGRRVKAIWLTHHHPDHVGGVEAARRALDVPVLAHPATAERLAAAGIAVDGELVDGERVVLAGGPPFPIRVIHTPGHARGHLCFLDETYGSLIAGDMVTGLGTVVIDPPEGNMDDYLSSLDKLFDLAPQALFPAHGPTIKNARAKLDEYRRHRRWREERVLEAWSAGLREPAEMLERVYDEVPPIARPLAERQIVAHLERLRRLGKLEG
jgi:glyoxylase-like metal-dependent hydrolase (beta-lactamase superfamily II)/8-oxo-dGTP pyrophosphatase MutT (NUDIX family)